MNAPRTQSVLQKMHVLIKNALTLAIAESVEQGLNAMWSSIMPGACAQKVCREIP